MSEDKLFSGEADHAEPAPQPTIPEGSSALDALVGEGKKYKDVEELAKSRLEADNFINQLQNETKGMREQLNTSLNMQSFLDRLESRGTANVEQPSPQVPTANDEGAQPAAGLTPEQVEAMVAAKLNESNQQARRNQNLQLARQKMEELGINQAMLQKITRDIGSSEADMENLAVSSPGAFARLLEASKPKLDTTAPPQSSVNTAGMSSGGKTHSYYAEMQRKDPKRYWSPEVQLEIYRNAMAMKEDFYK